MILRAFFHQRVAVGILSMLAFGVMVMPVNAAVRSEGDEGFLLFSQPTANETNSMTAKVTIDAPPEAVWQVITSYGRLKDILPGYEKSTVLKENGTVKTLDVAMKVSRLLPTYKYQVQVQENRSAHQLKLRRIAGDFKKLDAVYQLYPKNGGKQTVLVYELDLETGLRIPGTDGIISANTEKTMKALRAHIEEKYHKSVIGQR